ncbi:UvrD-helicase domain-containing protein [Luteolibacter ambystomatis]|uniref:DNA 3'-5' helicase n=1 Tax=Luteolibacter ambystomatis TaxID=2824561 RepID=A0A975G9E5_9BACT|nr:UvrD-helicase domain-containing protein [Luteolibacter ambystomatis]QUE51140.1 UvrD-helicase domain-containing protein [Luteolibacter ambystomatis]
MNDDAIHILERNLMILASAGSGKTFQLANRVIGLVGARGASPEKIVALTFTRKAAGEFADSVLSRLAGCASDPVKAAELCAQIGESFEVGPVLAKVVRALPRFQLGTMDGFFARIVRGFQYELGLTGGTFELIEGPRLEAAMADILSAVLGGALDDGSAEEFLHAFRRATLGKEGQGVLRDVEKFLGSWHGWWKSGTVASGWGGGHLFTGLPEVDLWETEKMGLLGALRRGESNDAVLKLIDHFELHTVGSGRVAKAGTLFERLLEAVPASGEMELAYNRKVIRFSLAVSDQWRDVVRLLAACELSASVARTRAVADLVARLDGECERRLRNRGLLGFDDVKVLMGRWAGDEEARGRREAVDFRLDARYDHWLLDEFQDTSVAEWLGIVPLLDEAATNDDGTLFVVGDRKQAIYGWRGGEVALFDEVERRYRQYDLQTRPMPKSWRSCPAVLDLVNAVCGHKAVIGSLFGEEMIRRWVWEDHDSAKPGLGGCATVEVVAKEDRDERLVELLHEIGIGERALTCGVLVRTNSQVREIATLLREHGFDVIEEGRRHPVEDNAVGVVLFHLMRWLADPADAFAEEVVRMSPLWSVVSARFPEDWYMVWEGLLKEARTDGFAAMAGKVVEPLWDGLSEFSRRRAGDVIGALAEFDAGGAATAREAARWLADLEIAQAPGVAAVQVMTIHKSKGLGFDVVVLPELEDGQVPDRGNFDVARGIHAGKSWLLEPPARWVRGLVPALAAAEEAWADDQRYEMLCTVYVALTRAKRGLHVLLPQVPKSRKDADDWASPANWIARAVGTDFQAGDPRWFESIPPREIKPTPTMPDLGPGVARRARLKPSGGGVAASQEGLRFGTSVHAAFERVGWLDEGRPVLPDDEGGRLVNRLIGLSKLSRWFERKGRNVELFREQPLEAIVNGAWMSGVIDRLHLVRDDLGMVAELEVFDFKTDRVDSAAELLERHAAQMDAYRSALQRAYGGAMIRCVLISSHLEMAVEVQDSGQSVN